MERTALVLRRIFSVVCGVCFGGLTWLCLTRATPLIPLGPAPILAVAGAMLLGGLVFALAGRWAEACLAKHPGRTRRIELVLVCGGFAIYLLLQLAFARALYPVDGLDTWDFTNIAEYAKQYVTTGAKPDAYFALYPNNIPYYVLLCLVFRPFAGLGFNLHTVGIGLNILMIDAALLLGWLVLKKLTGSPTAGLLYLGFGFASLPLLSYVAIYYTDTLTLPFPVGCLYLWLCAKQQLEAHRTGLGLTLCGLCAAWGALGMLLKLSAGFILIAIAVDACLLLGSRALRPCLPVLAAVFCAVYFPLHLACTAAPVRVQREDDTFLVPKTHWIMMGLHENGSYYDPDYQLTLSVPPDQREAFVRQEILRRVQAYGPRGLWEHQTEKAAFTWADGTYYSAIKLLRGRRGPSRLDGWLTASGGRFGLTALYCQALLLLNLAGITAGAFSLWQKKARSLPLFPALISVFGLFLFLSLWETRSRYLFNYLPVFLVISVWVLWQLALWLAQVCRARRSQTPVQA